MEVIEEANRQQDPNPVPPAAAAAPMEEDDDELLADIIAAQDDAQAGAGPVQLGDVEGVCEAELEAYKAFPILPVLNSEKPGEHNDPLEWWKKHESKFPILAHLAKLYLSLQATSAPSERQFSQAERLLSKKRNKIKPKTAGSSCLCAETLTNMKQRLDWRSSLSN